jgi:hypothetical protein
VISASRNNNYSPDLIRYLVTHRATTKKSLIKSVLHSHTSQVIQWFELVIIASILISNLKCVTVKSLKGVVYFVTTLYFSSHQNIYGFLNAITNDSHTFERNFFASFSFAMLKCYKTRFSCVQSSIFFFVDVTEDITRSACYHVTV